MPGAQLTQCVSDITTFNKGLCFAGTEVLGDESGKAESQMDFSYWQEGKRGVKNSTARTQQEE